MQFPMWQSYPKICVCIYNTVALSISLYCSWTRRMGFEIYTSSQTKTLIIYKLPVAEEKQSLFCTREVFYLKFCRTVTITFIKVCIIFCMLRKREAIGDFKSVIHHKTQQHSLDHFIPLSFFLVMFNDL